MKRKISDKNGFIMAGLLIVLVSGLYAFLIKIGIDAQNINLEKCSVVKSVVQDWGVGYRKGSKGFRKKVFYIELAALNKKIGVYRMSQDYEDLLDRINTGDTLKVYYLENSNKNENINIDLIQIERGTTVLLYKSEYEEKSRSMIYIGSGGILANIIILYFIRKRYLKTVDAKRKYIRKL